MEEKLWQKTDDCETKAVKLSGCQTEQQKALSNSGVIQMRKGYEDATCEKCDSMPWNEKTAG